MLKKVLVTGSAGFIGFHTVMNLAADGFEVVGLDNINDYYSPALKYSRLQESGVEAEQVKWHTLVTSSKFPNYRFVRMDLEDKQQLFSLFQAERFEYVINLAAQAGVRYSIENPDVYIQTNMVGFFHILEACRHYKVKHLVHASSSSVYGMNAKIPYSEDDKCDSPVSLYAATKKSNELMAHAYSHLYGIQSTCLRFFTVYGPYGRPDMAPMLFAKAICQGKPISIFNNGEMERDFTFVGDIVEGVMQATFNYRNNESKFNVLNIGNGAPVNLMEFISMLEKKLNKEAVKKYLPMQPGDVYRTWADQNKLMNATGYRPSTSLESGVEQFVNWFTAYYKWNKKNSEILA
jgi:Nucleoside-diphosphate-sugar epimerases